MDFKQYIEQATKSKDLMLYHGTDDNGISGIIKNGGIMKPNRYIGFFSDKAQAKRYGSVIIAIDASSWSKELLRSLLINSAEEAGYEFFADLGYDDIESADDITDENLYDLLGDGEIELLLKNNLDLKSQKFNVII